MSATDLLAALAPVGRSSRSGGYRRYAWTREDASMTEWFRQEASLRGLDVSVDRAGNLWAWWGDPDAAPGRGLVTGSHLDSVPDGGPFDGPLGVASAFAAVDLVRARGHVPSRPIGVVCFRDEEGGRFGIACVGSQLLTGELAPERALALRDRDGVTLAEAMRAHGHPVAGVGADPDALGRIGTFVELHVEQGRALADLDRQVAVGTEILAHGRWRIDLAGEANHAGTTRLEDRRDPMLALAAVIASARATAAARGCVATVGKVEVTPGAVNAIPSHVAAWLDARSRDEATAHEVAREVAAAGGTTAVEESFTRATAFDERLATRLSTWLDDAPLLPTGAGHDAGTLATAGIPTAMLFVRNPTGVSHSPHEYAEPADCEAGVAALAEVLVRLS